MKLEQLIALLAIILPTSLSYLYSKKLNINADKNKIKQEYYRKYIESLSLITDGEINHGNKVRHAKASNDLYIIASREVILALQAYQNTQIAHSSGEMCNSTMSDVVRAMRSDLGIKSTNDWQVKLWTAGKR